MNFLHRFEETLTRALRDLVPDPAPFASLVKATVDPRHGDYQANCAMTLARSLGKPPREVAQIIKDRIDLGDWLTAPDIAGPGFLNVRIRTDWLARQLQEMARSDRLGVPLPTNPRTYVVDFSSPNVAKPMHVGHLRSTIIGDSLVRLLRFLGHRVISDNHLGDWGTQFGILLHGYKNFRNDAAYQENPVQELARLYKHVRSLMKKEDEDDRKPDPVGDACRRETAKLHAGDAENLRLWQQFMPHCYAYIETIYQLLDIRFDHQHGESFYHSMLAPVVEDLLKRRVAVETQGAIGVFIEEEKPPALIRKRDGAFTYTTSDLATIRYRVDHWKPDAILYVVDLRQELHFKNLAQIARRWGYDQVDLTHVAFGSVLDPQTHKPIKTREGDAEALASLLQEAMDRSLEVYDSLCEIARERGEPVQILDPAQRQHLARVIGIGAVKYADLSQNRSSDYDFNYQKMLAMDGNTATYMQYAYVRNRSILRKAQIDPTTLRQHPPEVSLEQPEERALALQLLRFEEALLSARQDYRPNQITSYLWDLSKAYSSFFNAKNCKVLKAETSQLRDSRLLICDLTARVIQQALGILGIQTVEEM